MAKPGPQRNSASIESLKERMLRDPFSRAFLPLAEEYRKAGRFDEAVQVCQEGLSRHPNYHTARISLGRTYLEAGRLEDARRTLAEVLDLAPENHLAAKLLAEVQRRMGDLAGAAETYRSILKHYSGDREVEALLKDLLESQAAPVASAAPVQSAAAAPPVPSRPSPATPPALSRPSPAAPPPAPPQTARPAQSVPAPPPRPAGDPSLDYSPEDLAAVAPAGAPRRATFAAAAGTTTDALQTNTLAELYLRQGLVDKAIEVYQAMLRVDPDNRRAGVRLLELTSGRAAGPDPRAATEPRPITTDTRPAAPLAGPAPVKMAPVTPVGVAVPPADRRSHPDAIARLERWLQVIRAGPEGTRRETSSR